jgi:WD40 repeat protein
VGPSTFTIYTPIANPGGVPAAELSSAIEHVILSQDGESLIVSDSLTSRGQSIHVRVFTMPDLQETFDLSGPSVGSDEPAIAFSPDNRQIALVGDSDGKVEIYNTVDGELTMTLDGHTQVTNQVVFSPDGKMIATGSNDNTICLWDAQSGELLHTLEGHEARVNRLAFSPDATWLVSGADDNTLRRWNTEAGDLLETMPLGEENWRVEFLDVLTDNTSVVYRVTKYPSPYIGYIEKQMIWDTQSGDSKAIGGSDIYLTRLSEEKDLFMGYSMGSTPGGWLVGTFQQDGSMRIISPFKSPYGNGALSHGLIISPNKSLVISANGFGLHAWEIEENALNFLGLVATQEAIPSYGNEYIFSSDGKTLAFTDGDGIAYLLGVTAP